MKPDQIARQAVDFQKAAFANWCSAVEMIQDQFISAMEAMMRQTDLAMPEEGRKAVKAGHMPARKSSNAFILT